MILARAQIALVIVGMNTSEDGDTLRIKPEAALIVETHTSQRRIRSAAEEAVKRIAAFAYGHAACAQHTEGAEFLECVAPAGDRRIVAALEGSLVVIGNSKTAVQSCLEVRRGQRPSLRTDADLLRMRSNLNTEKALASGYVSSANAARLFSWAAPLLMGKTPGDHQLEQLLGVSAAKILRGIAWSSESSGGGIQDRFLFSLEPSVVERLRPAFQTVQTDDEFWKLVPETFQSLTIYRSEDPQAAWIAMDSAVSSKLGRAIRGHIRYDPTIGFIGLWNSKPSGIADFSLTPAGDLTPGARGRGLNSNRPCTRPGKTSTHAGTTLFRWARTSY